MVSFMLLVKKNSNLTTRRSKMPVMGSKALQALVILPYLEVHVRVVTFCMVLEPLPGPLQLASIPTTFCGAYPDMTSNRIRTSVSVPSSVTEIPPSGPGAIPKSSTRASHTLKYHSTRLSSTATVVPTDATCIFTMVQATNSGTSPSHSVRSMIRYLMWCAGSLSSTPTMAQTFVSTRTLWT